MRNRERVWRHHRIQLYYAAVVFIVMTLSLFVTGAGAVVLYLTGVWRSVTLMAIGWLAAASLLIGAVVSAAISRRVLSPVIRLSEAARRVAQGDFSVRLENPGRLEEIRTTYDSFNDMVQELGATETLRNDFVANVSHEFKTPINAIEGYAMLLQDPALTGEERQEYIDRILEGTRRLSTLVSDILMLSKLDNGVLTVQRETFRLDEQIRQALLQLEPRWSEKRLELDVELDSVQYTGFEALCMQLWTNLIGNAVKFSPEGGTVRVLLRDRDTRIVVTVADEGEGMSEETQRYIFEKFYQGDTSHRSEGNGLGLALVKRIVAACEGSIAVESVPGEGAVFTLELPKRSES